MGIENFYPNRSLKSWFLNMFKTLKIKSKINRLQLEINNWKYVECSLSVKDKCNKRIFTYKKIPSTGYSYYLIPYLFPISRSSSGQAL